MNDQTREMRKDLWVNDDGLTAEVYRSTVTRGSRYSMNGRDSVYKVRGAHLGRIFGSRIDAHSALVGRGFRKA